MKNTTHRVVILKNINSELVSQAILFLKDNEYASDSRIMQEAEKIVARYMGKKTAAEKKVRPSPLIVGILSAAVIGSAIFFISISKLF